MRVHLIQTKTVRLFANLYPASKAGLEEWLTNIKTANRKMPGDIGDIKKTFNSADLLGKACNRIIFNISGNHFRMICKYAFGENQVYLFVCWIGTHAAYDKICKENKQYTVSLY